MNSTAVKKETFSVVKQVTTGFGLKREPIAKNIHFSILFQEAIIEKRPPIVVNRPAGTVRRKMPEVS